MIEKCNIAIRHPKTVALLLIDGRLRGVHISSIGMYYITLAHKELYMPASSVPPDMSNCLASAMYPFPSVDHRYLIPVIAVVCLLQSVLISQSHTLYVRSLQVPLFSPTKKAL